MSIRSLGIGRKGDTGATGPTGPAGLGTVTPSTPARALATNFQPSATKATFVSYTTMLTVTNPLLAGTSTAQISLFSDASNPPTTERARHYLSSGVGLAVAVAITQIETLPLQYICPAGHFVRLVATTTGTATATLGAVQVESALG